MRPGAWLAALLTVATSAFAQAPLTSGIERLVADDAAAALRADDPEARGEAALIVAAAGRREHEARLLALAADPEPAARHRATIALGLLATPSALQQLEAMLDSVEGRESDDGVVAAYALGAAAPERVGSSVARTLATFRRGSWKRQHDTLKALLLGMARHPGRGERQALRQLFDDDANRADDVRALLLRQLLPTDTTFEQRDLLRILRRGGDAEQLALLEWLATRPAEQNDAWLDELMRVARHDGRAERRIAALAALTRSRHLPALDLAARALRRRDPAECAQGMTTIFAIGGASARGALERHLIDERDPRIKAALLRAFAAPPSERLLEHAVALATDASQPLATRAAAAELVARGDGPRATALLRDLFRAVDDPALLAALARALHRVEGEPTQLDRLLERPVSLPQHPERWRALLLAGHGDAQRAVLATLHDAAAPAAHVRAALKAWRQAMVLPAPGDGAPEPLRDALD